MGRGCAPPSEPPNERPSRDPRTAERRIRTPPVAGQSAAEFDSPELVEELDLTDAPAPAVDLLHTYVRQIGDGALLTQAEELELARRKDRGDMEAKRPPGRGQPAARDLDGHARTRRPACRCST